MTRIVDRCPATGHRPAADERCSCCLRTSHPAVTYNNHHHHHHHCRVAGEAVASTCPRSTAHFSISTILAIGLTIIMFLYYLRIYNTCPRSTALLQTSPIGRVESFCSWSSHLFRGRPGGRRHVRSGGRLSDTFTWR